MIRFSKKAGLICLWLTSAAAVRADDLKSSITAHLPGELSADEILNGAYPFPPSPAVKIGEDWSGFATNRLSKIPAAGVHPRILMSPEDLPDLRRRVAETEMGRELLKNLRARVNATIKKPDMWGTKFYDALAAGDMTTAKNLLLEKNGKPPSIGHYQPFIEAFAMEALDALLSKDKARGKKVGTVLANYSLLAEPAIDNALVQPLGDDVWRVKINGPTTGDWGSDQGARDLVGYHILGYTYDFAYNFMNESQRAQVRRVISKVTRGELWMGARLPHHFRNWNWCAVGLSQPLLALAIEGEDGYDPRVFKMGVEIARDYFSYGVSEHGFSTEAVGYTQFGLVWANPFVVAAARRGENLLTQNHLRAMIDWYLHSMEPVALSFGRAATNADWEQIQRSLPQAWTSHGDGGDEGPAIWTMAMWKYFYPHDPKVDLLWRVVVNKTRGAPFSGPFHLIEPLLFANAAPITLKPDAAEKLHLPFVLFDPQRSSLIVHSGWNPDAVVLQFECRTDSVGASHEHADRGAFTFSALGRQWAKDNFRSVETKYHNSILIDGMGQGQWAGPGEWLGLQETGKVIVAACNAKPAYDWFWPKQIITEDPTNFVRFGYARWETYRADSEAFHQNFSGQSWERDLRPSVVAHWRGFEQGDPRMWDEDSWPVRLPHNPVQRAFRSVALVRGAHPFALVVDDIQKDAREHLYEWLMQTGPDTEIASLKGDDIILADASVARDADGLLKPKNGDRQLLVRVLEMNSPARPRDYTSRPAARLETFERKDTLVAEVKAGALSGARSFGLDKRLVITSRSVAPDFKILLFPFRAGEPLPVTRWDKWRSELTIEAAGEKTVFRVVKNESGRTELTPAP